MVAPERKHYWVCLDVDREAQSESGRMKKVVLGKTCLEMLAKDYHLCSQGIFVPLSTIPHRFPAKRVMQMGHYKP